MPYNVLKDGVINEEEQDYEDYNSDTTELVYSSDEEKPRCKRTTSFLVFASENKKDKTDRTIMYLGSPSSKLDLDWMTQLGERWKDLSEEEHTNYAKKAELINNHYAEIMDVELD